MLIPIVNPDCLCQEAVLNFVQVYPREGKKADRFMIRLKLSGRGYKIHDQGKFHRSEMKDIIRHLNADSKILKQLNDRFMEMREKVKKS